MRRRDICATALLLAVLASATAGEAPESEPCAESVQRGKALFKKGETEAALAAFESAARIAETSQLPHCQGEALYRVGLSRDHLGQLDQAAEPLDRAEAIGSALGDKRLLARIWNHRGLQARLLARFDEAEEYFLRSEAAFRALGERVEVSTALGNIGLVCLNRGDFARGLEAGHKALDVDPRNSYAMFNIALIYELQGEDALALDFYRRAAAVDREDGDVVHEAISVIEAANTQSRLGDASAALQSYAAARQVLEKAGDEDLLGFLESGLGWFHARAGRHDEAVRHLTEAVRLMKASPLHLGAALRQLSAVQLAAGRPADALVSARRSLEIVGTTGSWGLASEAWTAIGAAQEALGDTEQARAAYEQAVSLVEVWRGHLAGDEPARQRFFEERVSPYHRLLAIAVGRGSMEEALHRAEQARARVLVEVLQQGRQIGTRLLTPEERAQEAAAQDAVRVLELRREAAGESGASRAGIERELETARRSLAATRTALVTVHRDLSLARGEAESVTLEGLAPLLADGSAAVAFTVAQRETYAFAFTAAPDGAVRVASATLPVGEEAWRDRARAFRAALARRDLDIGGEAQALYRDLLGPLGSAVAGHRRLYVVPDGPLWEIPFAALQPRSHHDLIEDVPLAMAPSLTALAAWRSRPAHARSVAWEFLGISATDFGPSRSSLRDVTRHTRAVASLYGPTAHTLLDRDATEARAKAEMGRARVLHFATHGLVEPASPLYSALLLARAPKGSADDGRLEAREILDLDLPADLAVLSACETARGRIGAGEGVIGLSWAFSVAGVRNTVVSLWSVEEESTAALMLAFHRAARRGQEYPEALRTAALALRRDPGTRHPFYWAAFVVIGDGRRSGPPSRSAAEAPGDPCVDDVARLAARQ